MYKFYGQSNQDEFLFERYFKNKNVFFNCTIYHQERVPQLKILDSGLHSNCSLFWVLGGHWKVDHLNVHSPNALSVPKFYASSLFF